mmetsp:Transcript_105905/g.299569  ORF Transcript_105905/g.299569 Transcript_105905/m.299569 type:complete len:306 (-) Transcript_105905:79-996(-)
MKAMCTRIWCVLPVRIRSCTRVNQRSSPQNLVLPLAGTRHCRRARYLLTAGSPSPTQMTLPNSRREKSCHFFIGTSTMPTSGASGPPSRPSTRAMYSFCIRWAEFWTVKCRNASQDFPKICTPLVWLSSRWQMPRCRGSFLLGMSNLQWATWMKFVGDSSHKPLWSVTTNIPAGFEIATKLSDSATFSTSHHWHVAGAPSVRSRSGVIGRSKHSDSTSFRHQNGLFSISSSSHHQLRSSARPRRLSLGGPSAPTSFLRPSSSLAILRRYSAWSWKCRRPRRYSSVSLSRSFLTTACHAKSMRFRM